MRHAGKNTHTQCSALRPFSLRRLIVLIAVLALSLVTAASASAASFETVGHFGGVLKAPAVENQFPEEVQLGAVSDLAVNTTGAGGVAPGTVYAIGQEGGVNSYERVAKFGPTGSFEEAWNIGTRERCGPATAEPVDPSTYIHCTPSFQGTSNLAIDIDQATGNVYVFFYYPVEQKLVPGLRIYNPNGSKIIAEFGEAAATGTIAESPGKIHGRQSKGGIAVDDAGVVYLFDEDDTFHHRIMLFKPEVAGDYENYVYSGQGSDFAVGTAFTGSPTAAEPVLDQAGNLYGRARDDELVEYNSAHSPTPVCSFKLPAGGINTQTVNPVTGELFFFSYKNRGVHQLRCNGEGKFVEISAFAPTPVRGPLEAMTMDGERKFGPGRSAGVLYGASPQALPSTGGGGEPGAGPLGYVFAPAEENPPEVISESVANVTTTTATLHAQINPRGSLTRYVFQYISEAAYEANEPSDRFAGASEAPLGGANLGEAQSTLSAAVGLSGLVPDTAYRYRVVATSHCAPAEESKVCETAGADEAFRTYPAEAPGLPDDRAWELVSPAQKYGGEVIPSAPDISNCGGECKPGVIGERFPQQSSPDGEAVAYMGFPFSFSEGAVNFNEYVSRRTAVGWQTTVLSPELVRPGGGQGYLAFDTALNRGLLYQQEVTLTPESPSGYANIYSQPTAAPSALTNLLNAPPFNRPEGGGKFHLTYAGASPDLSHVFFEANDALTEETPFAPEAVDGGEQENNLYEWSAEGLRLVNVAPGNAATNPGAVFGSGLELAAPSGPQANLSHAISSDGSRAFWSSESGQVYARENAETTREISDHTGKFLTASADGSKLLLSDGHLFELDNGEAMVDLTEGKGGFEGIAGQSEDLSRIYFVDTQVLDETPNGHGDVAQEGKNNLYAWQEGSSRFIATLLTGDGPAGGGGGVWASSPGQRTAEASPNGSWLTFLSRGKQTGYDNTGSCKYSPEQKKFIPSDPCPEAYLYDSATGELRCASCNPSGEAPLGLTRLRLISGAGGFLPQPRYLTNEGRLYFDTQDSLSAFDTNEGVEDVYQYEPEGVGTCKREGGCVTLVSAGHEGVDSNFVTMDESGKNVFFTSRDQLTLRDKDELIDLYDAREGGGISAESEVARSECQGEACQPLYAAPNDPTPGSSSFEGAGNVTEPKAAKKHAKKHKKKHAKKKHAHKRAAKHNRGGAK